MNKLSEQIIGYFKKKKPDDGSVLKKAQTKKISMLLGIAAFGVLLMLVGSFGSDSKSEQESQANQLIKEQTSDSGLTESSGMTKTETELADKVRQLLSQIQGAGEVEVSVHLATSSQSQYAVNTVTGQKTTEEKDQGGGTRILTETTENGQLVLIRGDNGSEVPVVAKESAPEIAGVLVVAQGAGDPQIKARLFEATRVALGVEAHKIMVMPKKEGE
ncbi:stage III sporulation protein AG [Desulfolucanica intricata]|uniref:stage III sporulation protein AG n=1 Tax=Desulfolucanica intricata TaxID=1285191 RepID=UPI00082BB3F3|nr:stage III sporulation protein AG [Desulfolucanica intricata]